MGDFDVVVAAGSLRSSDAAAVQFPHRWTDEGVTIESAPAQPDEVDRLLSVVDDVAEIPKAIRGGADVHRVRAGNGDG